MEAFFLDGSCMYNVLFFGKDLVTNTCLMSRFFTSFLVNFSSIIKNSSAASNIAFFVDSLMLNLSPTFLSSSVGLLMWKRMSSRFIGLSPIVVAAFSITLWLCVIFVFFCVSWFTLGSGFLGFPTISENVGFGLDGWVNDVVLEYKIGWLKLVVET